jgi:clan AA aspartic protease (TIGR02281 family)
MSPISRLHFTLLFFALLFPSFCADGESHPTLTVGQSAVYLYATHGGDSETITKLEEGEKLTLLARAVSKGSWYMVKTQKGTVGWVRSSDVKESNRLEKTFEETASLPSPAFPANELPPPSGTTSKGASTVSVEMTGSSLVVPVVLNRSVKTYMIMDTGSSFTAVTPVVAKRLGLRLGSRVSVLTANGTIVVPLARLESLKVGNAEVHGLVVTVQSFSPDPRIEGLLGLNFLSRFHTSIDSQRQALTLAPR